MVEALIFNAVNRIAGRRVGPGRSRRPVVEHFPALAQRASPGPMASAKRLGLDSQKQLLVSPGETLPPLARSELTASDFRRVSGRRRGVGGGSRRRRRVRRGWGLLRRRGKRIWGNEGGWLGVTSDEGQNSQGADGDYRHCGRQIFFTDGVLSIQKSMSRR